MEALGLLKINKLNVMTRITLIQDKNNSFSLSTQVQNILLKKGYSHFFNYTDYKYFKSLAKSAFNKAEAIAELFILENDPQNSDFHDYVF